MKRFLRENWLWIVLPMVLAVCALGFLVVFFDDGEVAPFIYPL